MKQNLYFILGRSNVEAFEENETDDIYPNGILHKTFENEGELKEFIAGMFLVDPSAYLIITEDEYRTLTT